MSSTSSIQQFNGTVVSKSQDKTIIVKTTEQKRHTKYHKRYTATKRFAVHDPENQAQVGDTVTIQSSRPISKTKHFVLSAIVGKDLSGVDVE